MAKLNIAVEPQYRDMIAYSILKIADEHKRYTCEGEECTVVLFPFRRIVEQLLERKLTEEESKILS